MNIFYALTYHKQGGLHLSKALIWSILRKFRKANFLNILTYKAYAGAFRPAGLEYSD